MNNAKLILMVRLLAHCPHVLTGSTAERLDPDEVAAELGQWADALLARCVPHESMEIPEGERQPPGPEPTDLMMRAIAHEAAEGGETICNVSCPCCCLRDAHAARGDRR